MRKVIEQAVVTLDGQVSTSQDWLPTRWAGEFEKLSRDLLFSVDAPTGRRIPVLALPGHRWQRRTAPRRD
jgi:hypothetical protein